MKHIKKILSTITALALMLSLSGCYWEGKTKWHSEQLLLDELEEKYNEEFIIQQISVSSARSGGPLVAYCSPKDDEELVFEVELYQFGDSGHYTMYDMYIQSIVRREMKNKIDTVFAEQYKNFAVEIYVQGLQPDYDSGITNADETSIITFTEALPDKNASIIFIAINKNEVNDYYEIESLLVECVKDFHYTYAVIECYFSDNQIIEECNKIVHDDSPDALDIMTVLSSGNCLDDIYILHKYCYWGLDNEFALVEIVDSDGVHRVYNQDSNA